MGEQSVECERRITSDLNAEVSGRRHVNRGVRRKDRGTTMAHNVISATRERRHRTMKKVFLLMVASLIMVVGVSCVASPDQAASAKATEAAAAKEIAAARATEAAALQVIASAKTAQAPATQTADSRSPQAPTSATATSAQPTTSPTLTATPIFTPKQGFAPISGTFTAGSSKLSFYGIYFHEGPPSYGWYYPSKILGVVDFIVLRISKSSSTRIKFSDIKSIEFGPNPKFFKGQEWSVVNGEGWGVVTLRNGRQMSGSFTGEGSGDVDIHLLVGDSDVRIDLWYRMEESRIDFD